MILYYILIFSIIGPDRPLITLLKPNNKKIWKFYPACAAIKAMQTGLQGHMVFSASSTLVWRDKTSMVHNNKHSHRHTHTHTGFKSSEQVCSETVNSWHNQNGKPGWEPSICLGEMIITTVSGSWGRLRQTRGEEGTATLWRLFFKVWQLQPTSGKVHIWV